MASGPRLDERVLRQEADARLWKTGILKEFSIVPLLALPISCYVGGTVGNSSPFSIVPLLALPISCYVGGTVGKGVQKPVFHNRNVLIVWGR